MPAVGVGARERHVVVGCLTCRHWLAGSAVVRPGLCLLMWVLTQRAVVARAAAPASSGFTVVVC